MVGGRYRGRRCNRRRGLVLAAGGAVVGDVPAGVILTAAAATLAAFWLLRRTGAQRAVALTWKRSTLPGKSTASISALEPITARRWAALEEELARQGFYYDILETWRDRERQQHYLGAGDSQLSTSYHMHTEAGIPAAQALDVIPRGNLSELERVAHYEALRDYAPAYGLESGAAWSPGGTYEAYGLGWDPGHLQRDDVALRDVVAP
jgi:hypothetical protein